jgi:hypothetical protein
MAKFRKKYALNIVLRRKCSEINKCPVFNKDVLGEKMLKNNKNVLDYY